jgi:hypothetical protein
MSDTSETALQLTSTGRMNNKTLIQAEEAYQLGPRQLAQFYLKIKGYVAFIKLYEEHHQLDHPSESHTYIYEGFCHFADTMAVKGYPKFKRAYLSEGFWLGLADLALAKRMEQNTIDTVVQSKN